MKEKTIKDLYEQCNNYDITEEEKKDLSEYIEILSLSTENIQKKININNIVNLVKSLELFKGNQNDNKENS